MNNICENTDEFWDLYDRDRNLTGRRHRRGDKMKDGEYHLAVHVCIFNSKNQLLIQHRQPYKSGWPNMWDLSVGGSALAGDSSAMAAEREVMEELGLKLDLSDIRPFFTMHFANGFDDYYLIEKDVDISELVLQEEEVKEVRWAGKEEVLQMQKEGTIIPYWFLDKLFDIREFYGAYRDVENIKIGYAEPINLASWMSLVEVVKENFPGLETDDKVNEYKNTVIKNMNHNSAVCALNGNMVVGILLFSTKQNMISCMAVHPEFRRKEIASRMINLIMENFDSKEDITVETFREDDKKENAARAFYRSIGFEEGELFQSENGYPLQMFRLKQNDEKE